MFQQPGSIVRRKTVASVLAALCVGALLVLTAPALSAAPSGTLTGTVTDDQGSPLSNICVNAGDDSAATMTDLSGNFSMTVLGDAALRISFRDCDIAPTHASEWYADARTENDATPVTVPTGTGVDLGTIELAAEATISGTVTDETSDPIADVCVTVEDTDRHYIASDRTRPDGTYTLTRLGAGVVVLRFDDCDDGGYVRQWYDAATDHDSAAPITVAAKDAITGIDAQLQTAGIITGTVTDLSGNPLADICIGSFQDYTGTAGTTSGPDGSYRLDGLAPGAHKVSFDPCESDHLVLEEFYDDASTPESATPVTVTAGATASGVDAALAPAAVVTGTVTETGGLPIEGVCVQMSSSEHLLDTEMTGADGTYVAVVAPGTYFVQYVACDTATPFTGKWFGGAATRDSATALVVAAGATVDASASLAAGPSGSFAGRITDVADAPGVGVCAVAFLGGDAVMFTMADGDGRFAFDDVASGEWFVGFIGCEDDSRNVVDIAGTAYWAQWVNGRRLVVPEDSAPDPIGGGAGLHRVVGAKTTNVDTCFGCGSVKVTGTERNGDAITVTFDEPDLPGDTSGAAVGTAASDWSYRLTCTPSTGSLGNRSVTGPGSPLTVTGTDPSVAYGCALAAVVRGAVVANSDPVQVATSATPTPSDNGAGGSTDQPAAGPVAAPTGTAAPGSAQPAPAKLAFTGAHSAALTWLALLMVALGIAATRSARVLRRRDASG